MEFLYGYLNRDLEEVRAEQAFLNCKFSDPIMNYFMNESHDMVKCFRGYKKIARKLIACRNEILTQAFEGK